MFAHGCQLFGASICSRKEKTLEIEPKLRQLELDAIQKCDGYRLLKFV